MDKQKSREYSRIYYEQHKDYYKIIHRGYYSNNKERHAKLVHDNYIKNRDQILEYHRNYYENNKEKILNNRSIYRKNNKDKIHHKKSKRSARERGAIVRDLTVIEWQEMKEYFNNACSYCLRQDRKLTMDHIIPINNGGNHTKDNIVPSCQPCNSKKGTKNLLQFIAKYH